MLLAPRSRLSKERNAVSSMLEAESLRLGQCSAGRTGSSDTSVKSESRSNIDDQRGHEGPSETVQNDAIERRELNTRGIGNIRLTCRL